MSTQRFVTGAGRVRAPDAAVTFGMTVVVTPSVTGTSRMYPSKAEYQSRYDAAVDATIRAGFALEDDRAALESFAKPELIAG